MHIGFLGLLGLLFIALKLMGHITWAWWIVTLPLWGGVALGALIALLVPLGAMVTMLVDKWVRR